MGHKCFHHCVLIVFSDRAGLAQRSAAMMAEMWVMVREFFISYEDWWGKLLSALGGLAASLVYAGGSSEMLQWHSLIYNLGLTVIYFLMYWLLLPIAVLILEETFANAVIGCSDTRKNWTFKKKRSLTLKHKWPHSGNCATLQHRLQCLQPSSIVAHTHDAHVAYMVSSPPCIMPCLPVVPPA